MKHKWNRAIFIIVYLAYTSIYIARVNLSMAGTELIAGDIVNTVQLGLLGSIFSTVYAVGRLINGGLSDKRPPWFMITTGLCMAGLSNILISFFPPFIGIFLLWTTNAYAQSMLWSSVLCIVSSIYEKRKAKQMTSIVVTSVATGNILSILLNTFLITRFGVKFAFIVPGMLTILLGGAVFLTTRNIEPVRETGKKHMSMLQLLKNKELRTMTVPAVFHGVMKENISLWMSVYIVDTYCVDLSTSAYYILLIPVIGFIGRTIYPVFYKLCKENENVVTLLGFIACIAFSIPLCFGRSNIVVSVLCLSFIYTAASMINTSMLSIYPMHYLSTGNVGSVSGIMDFATYLGAGVASAVYGVIIKQFGYLPMFLSWILISGVSAVVVWGIIRVRKKGSK